jgi:hypothetical protein
MLIKYPDEKVFSPQRTYIKEQHEQQQQVKVLFHNQYLEIQINVAKKRCGPGV